MVYTPKTQKGRKWITFTTKEPQINRQITVWDTVNVRTLYQTGKIEHTSVITLRSASAWFTSNGCSVSTVSGFQFSQDI